MICGASNRETPYNPPMDTTETSRFLPPDFDPSDFANIEPWLRQLEERVIDSAEALQRWLMDFSQLAEAVDECGTRRSIEYSRHTNDEGLEAAYMHFVEQIQPKLRPWYFKLQQKFVASPHRDALTGPKFELLGRQWQSDVDLFRPRNIELLTDALGADGRFEVHAASTGYDAGLLTQQVRPDVLLLDYELPDVNGEVVCSTIRKHPELSGTKIIAISGHAGPGDVKLLLDAGADTFVAKPFDVRELLTQIVALVGS